LAVRWLIELAVAASVLGFAIYTLVLIPYSPVAVTAEREIGEQAFFLLLQLSSDPGFITTLDRAICGDTSAGEQLRSILESTISLRYYYNFTVYLDDVRPPSCLICAKWHKKLYSASRPPGFPPEAGGKYAQSVAVNTVLLSDGVRVRLELAIGRP